MCYRHLFRRVVTGLLIADALALAAWITVILLWPAYHYRAAGRALAEARPEEARQHLAVCLRLWPRHGPTRYLAARAARLAGDLEAAADLLDECERLQGHSESLLLERALVRAQAGDLDRVEPYLRARVAEEHPDTVQILAALTRGYVRTYRNPQALFCLKVWLEREPDNVEALRSRGFVWERVHNYAQAVRDYRRVLELDASLDDVRLRLANALLEISKAEEAVRHLEYLRQHRPEDPQVLVRLACGWHLLGRSVEARQLLDEVLSEHPHFVPALTGRGQLALQTGEPAGAERWLAQAVALEPYDYQANFLYYQCLKQSGKEQAAKEQQERLERIKASVQRMIEISNRELAQRPHDPALQHELGVLCLQFGNDDAGVGWLHSALRRDPAYRPAHQALADYYQRKGDTEQASRHRRLAEAPAAP